MKNLNTGLYRTSDTIKLLLKTFFRVLLCFEDIGLQKFYKTSFAGLFQSLNMREHKKIHVPLFFTLNCSIVHIQSPSKSSRDASVRFPARAGVQSVSLSQGATYGRGSVRLWRRLWSWEFTEANAAIVNVIHSGLFIAINESWRANANYSDNYE